MTSQHIRRKAASAVRAEFPIADVMEGWFFRQREFSNWGYVVEGTDLWGRTVSRQGGDPDALLSECVADAQEIEAAIKRAL